MLQGEAEPVLAEDVSTVLVLLDERRDNTITHRARLINQLHGLLSDLLPGGRCEPDCSGRPRANAAWVGNLLIEHRAEQDHLTDEAWAVSEHRAGALDLLDHPIVMYELVQGASGRGRVSALVDGCGARFARVP